MSRQFQSPSALRICANSGRQVRGTRLYFVRVATIVTKSQRPGSDRASGNSD